MDIIRENLIFDYNFTKGDTSDASGNSLDLTLSGGEVFKKGKYGLAVNTSINSGSLTSPATSFADDIDSFTFVFSGDIRKALASGKSFLRRSDGLFYIFSSTTNALNVFNNSISSIAAYTFLGYEKTIIITKASGSSTPKLYIDGIYRKDFNANQTFPSGSGTTFQILSGGVFNEYDCNSMVLYSDEKTADEITQIHKAIVSRKTSYRGKKNFDHLPSVEVPSSGSAWNAQLSQGKVIDQGVDGYHGTPVTDLAASNVGGLTQDKMPWGGPALRSIKTENGHLNMGASANLNFTSGAFGYIGWFRPGNTGNEMLMSKSGSFFFQAPGTGQLQISLGSGAYTAGKIFSFAANQAILAGFFKDADNEYCMLNGEELFSQATTAYGLGGTTRIGQYVALGYSIAGLIGPQVAFRRFNSAEEYFAYALEEYKSKAKLPVIHNLFDGSYIHQSAYGAGPLPGTDFYVKSGTFKVSSETVDGVENTKVLECVTAGVVALKVPDYAFGTWDFYINKADASDMNIQWISDSNNYSSAGGYRLNFTSAEALNIQEVASGTPTTKASMASAITAGSWHKIRQEVDNYFTTYIDDVEVVETSGTHPFQDFTYTINNFLLIDMDAGDKFTDGDLMYHKFGVL